MSFCLKSIECYFFCCRKTAVCDGDQLLDFSIPEHLRSQSTFSTDLEILKNYAGYTLCSSAGSQSAECSAVIGFTPCMLCVQIYCALRVLDYAGINLTGYHPPPPLG